MELNTIQQEGTWNEIADSLNYNFNKLNLAIESGVGGGGGGSVSPELVEQIARNTSNITTLQTSVNRLNANANTVGSVDYKVNHFQWLVIE